MMRTAESAAVGPLKLDSVAYASEAEEQGGDETMRQEDLEALEKELHGGRYSDALDRVNRMRCNPSPLTSRIVLGVASIIAIIGSTLLVVAVMFPESWLRPLVLAIGGCYVLILLLITRVESGLGGLRDLVFWHLSFYIKKTGGLGPGDR